MQLRVRCFAVATVSTPAAVASVTAAGKAQSVTSRPTSASTSTVEAMAYASWVPASATLVTRGKTATRVRRTYFKDMRTKISENVIMVSSPR